MNTNNRTWMNYRLMVILALIVGVAGIALQFMPGFELLSFMLSVAVLGCGQERFAGTDRGLIWKGSLIWVRFKSSHKCRPEQIE